MSVQPIAPQSRQASQHISSGTPVGPTHPYANASASAGTPSPITAGVPGGMQMSGPYPRTTSNSPLPPIPGDAGAGADAAQRNVVGSGAGLGALNAMNGMNGSRGELAGGGGVGGVGAGAYSRPIQRGMNGTGPPGAKTRMSYDREMNVGGAGYDQERAGERKKGFFAMLCCRA